MDIKFNAKNKKDIVTAAIFIFIMALFFQLLYLPGHKEAKKLKNEYIDTKKEIDGLYDFIGGQENLKDNIIKIRKDLVLLEKAFPLEKEVSNIIKQLNEQAGRFNISVISLKPGNFEIYKDSEGKEIMISDYFCKTMPLTLSVESRYQALGEFLMNLETNRTPIISVKELEIEKKEGISPKIKAEIDLTTYILGK